MIKKIDGLLLSSSLELELAIFGTVTIEVDKLSFKAQTNENLINLQAVDSLSKWKVAMVEVRCQAGMILNKGTSLTSQRMLECLLARGSSSAFLSYLPHGGNLRF